jgi:3-hydroxy-3-methylglutaryl CoA synthase
MRGITAYGSYVPYHRLQRAAIGEVLGSPGARGERAVACHDEDTTSMGVEACRRALWNGARPAALLFATTAPAYLDKTNATAIHAALELDDDVLAADVGGAVRSSTAAVRAALACDGMAVLSDIRIGRPGSDDERYGGDAAVAFVFGEGEDVVAEVLAEASITAEFLDRWRQPGASASSTWEERFGLQRYVPLIGDAATRALAAAGIQRADHVIVSSPHARAARTALKGFGDAAADGLDGEVGYAGAAHAGLVLADVLDRAAPGETILLLLAADGCDATVLRVTDAIARRPAGAEVRAQIANRRAVPYGDFLTWRGVLEREPPRRPDPARTAAPPAARTEAWKYAFVGSRCRSCDTVQLPPQRVCVHCRAVDDGEPWRLADRQATVATMTVDRLAFSLAPPTLDVVLDFDGGGRFACQMTDVDVGAVRVGDRVEMTFRRISTAQGIHNYFWKARPARAVCAEQEGAH